MMKTTVIVCYMVFSCILGNRAHAQLSAGFTADSTEGCNLLELSLTNLSTGATSYLWEIYDSGGTLVTSSTLTNPTFFLITPGAYTVSLTAYNGASSDNLTISDFAFVYTNPVAAFISSDIEGCPGTVFTFSDDSEPGSYGSVADYYWVITGASTLPSTPTINYIFEAPGTYTVYLFVTDGAGCSDYATQTITIYDSVHADFTSDAGISCSVPLTVSFTNLSTGTGSLTYQWDFGDGSTSTELNPTHNYTAYGDYDVSLIVTNTDGCSDTILYSDYIQVHPTASVDFTVSPDTICAGESISFDNLSGSSVGIWAWDFGDGGTSSLFEPSHTYTTAGTYTVTLDGDFGGGCTGSITYPDLIYVIAAPTVTFTSTTASTVCEVPFSVTFTPVVGGGPITTYLWEFETSTGTVTSSSSNPTFSWTELGTYDVSLTVTNTSGCTATYIATDYVTIGDLVVTASASPASGCAPITVNFSASAGEPLSTYNWDLGDGTTSTSPTPSNVYSTVGCYTITLIATSVSGCTDTVTITDMVCAGDTGTAQILVPDTVCPGAPIEVFYLPLDSITADIDGGLFYSIATDVDSITTIVLPTGDHTVDFITWSYGCPDTVTASVYVLDVVDSLMQVDYNCSDPYTVQIYIDTALAAASCGWIWDFGDGTTDSVSMNPIHTYSAPGEYHVVVTYECITAVECQGTGVFVDIQVPYADFTADPAFGCDTPLLVNFTNISTDYIDDNLTYSWDFGDGSPIDASENPSHTFSDYNAYLVTLIVTDDRGCTDSFTDTITINQVNAGYTVPVTGGCVPFTIELTDTSSALFGEIETWVIDWSDGTIDTFYNYADVIGLEHTFYENDNFFVTLTAIDAFGCSDDFVDTIKAGLPEAAFIVDDTIPCVGQLIYFTEESTGFSLDYMWDFGDGTTSDAANPSHTYSSIGTYTVTLIVTDVNGCTDTLIEPAYITVDTVAIDFVSGVLVASCNYALIEFTSFTSDSICSYLWEFGDGGISVDPNPIYPYLTAGEFTVSLTVTDCNGCSSTIIKSGYVLVPGPYGFITFSDDTLCVDHPYEIYVTVASTDTFSLYLDNGDVISVDVTYSDSLQTITIPYTYTTAGTYYPNALLVDTNSCLNVIFGTDSIRVGNNPDALYAVPDPTQCIGTPITFADSSSGADPIILWTWNFGDGTLLLDSSATITYLYADTGLYNTSLYVYTEYGCVDSMFIDVNILPYPLTTLTPDTALCPGQDILLNATGGDFYTWQPGLNLSDSTIANPLASPTETTLYTVEVSNGYCSVFDSVLITIVDELILYAGPDTSLCIGDEIQLYAEFVTDISINNISYYWSPSDFLTDPYIPNPVSSAIDDITYIIYASCGILNDTADAIIKIAIPPDVEIPEDTILIIQGQSVVLSSELIGGDPPITYLWQPAAEVDCPGCEDVTVSPGSNQIFSVQVTDVLGCTDIDFVLVRVLTCDESLFFIPNIMTPNNDGRNDVFKFSFEGGITEVKNINIYNRWGELMFHTDNIDEHWDGSYNGVLCNPGVYVYTFDAICLDGSQTIVKGNVTLVK